jgi:hypothetical protein
MIACLEVYKIWFKSKKISNNVSGSPGYSATGCGSESDTKVGGEANSWF